MSLPEIEYSKELLQWYESHVQPFLRGKLQDFKIDELDKDSRRLKRMLDVLDTELAVCLLGSSGIGKSTLINALVGGRQAVVPSGGVGPLTAQALVVRYGEQSGFEVEYHGPQSLWRTIFGLQQSYRTELGPPPADVEIKPEAIGLEESDLPAEDDDKAGEDSSEAADGERRRRALREQLRRRAQLLVTGAQDEERDLRYLLDSMREAAGSQRIWGTVADPADAGRIRGIQEALASGTTKVTGDVDDPQFQEALRAHATGYLAPLIKNLTIFWPSVLLQQGITLVDLPGVGIVSDVHKSITRKWIREKARALVLVVDHRGLTESLAAALRESEFLNSLLYSADEPEDDPILMVVVTRIDDLASTAYQQDKSKKKFEHFRDAVNMAKERLRADMQRHLDEIWLADASATEARKQVVRNLLASMQVHPLSAPEYAKFLADDEDDRPFLREAGQTGVPEFIESLRRQAFERRTKVHRRLAEQADLFRERAVTTIRLIEAQWGSETRAEEEVRQLRGDLDHFIRPLREELLTRQGAYRNFLKKTAPQRINDLVEGAKQKAIRDIERYLRRLGDSHWMTLRASVRRGGRYSGASDINLPNECALRFEEPIAEVWSKVILQDIRNETRDYADACVKIVEEVAAWALKQGARVQSKMIEAQRDAIRADAKKLVNVGREMVEEVREEARSQLIAVIEEPIRKECQSFVRKNLDVGRGVKQRILDLYAELAGKVVVAAEEPAVKILRKLFKQVESEIVEAFADNQDPLKSLSEAIVTSQQQYLERSDAQKRRHVLSVLRALREACPRAPGMEAEEGDENLDVEDGAEILSIN